jgi:hypothetical protein
MMVFDSAGAAAPLTGHRARDVARGPKVPTAPGASPGSCAGQSPCAAPPPATIASGREARVCPLCGSEHVYPLHWRRQADNTWAIRLRCPNCETRREVVMERPGVEQLNRELYRAHQPSSMNRDPWAAATSRKRRSASSGRSATVSSSRWTSDARASAIGHPHPEPSRRESALAPPPKTPIGLLRRLGQRLTRSCQLPFAGIAIADRFVL